LGLVSLLLLYLFLSHVIPRPAAIRPEGWRLLAIFVSTVVGLIVQPMPGGAIVFLAILAAASVGGLTLAQALSGYADPTVWLVLAAFAISRALINTGLARRLALWFVRSFGGTSIGVCYALSLSDTVLAAVIPSAGARSGGVILPIVRSIAELYGSRPGPTAAVIGSFLMSGVYQAVCVSSAMFFTGQASNPLVAKFASDLGYTMTWTSWFAAGIVPGICSLLLVPWAVLRVNAPQIRRTPEAASFASDELRKMGGMSRAELIATAVFAGVCGLWVTSNLHGIDITLTALGGVAALLVSGVLSWEDIKSERAAWDVFIWYGGLLMLGKALNEAQVTAEFARLVSALFGWAAWPALFAGALLIYFYAHYAFASITAHVLSMYVPFVAILLARDAPAGLVFYAFACFANFSAGLTHYGTTPGPMFFGHDYVPLRTWWKVGFVVSLVNLAIWSTAGFLWWKAIGIW
jgi:DASS family divalent anion:Na+ symporter